MREYEQSNIQPNASAPNGSLVVPSNHTLLGKLDAWMQENPWHPRVAPFAAYIIFMPLVDYLRHHVVWLGPVAYTLQTLFVTWLLWRYRKLLPEMTLRFHWLSLVVGLGVLGAWIALAHWMTQLAPDWFATDSQKHYLEHYGQKLRCIGMPLRFLGMALVVPVFEELFVRSLLLRSLHRFRITAVGVFQSIYDMPVIGDWLGGSDLVTRANRHPPVFGDEFNRTPLGALSFFGVFASTVIFASYHVPRDWPGCVVCAIAYCLLLKTTAPKGLGPTIWAHGITNAGLWAYVWTTGDWQFL